MSEAATVTAAPIAEDRAGEDEKRRVRSAANSETEGAVLLALTRDPSPMVRVAVAMNAATPSAGHTILAEDADDRVRALLGRALAEAMARNPVALRLSALPDGSTALDGAITVLSRLISDPAVRVRAAIADSLAEMPNAPRNLVLRLARDPNVPVSEPIVRLSSLLTNDDLLALLLAPPTTATATAIARRPYLSEAVCDAIAATGNQVAIRAILANPHAVIRNQTLETLVTQASEHGDWHEPLVLRPNLSAGAAQELADFVTLDLLSYLAKRSDFDPAATEALAAKLRHRVATQAAPGSTQRGKGQCV